MKNSLKIIFAAALVYYFICNALISISMKNVEVLKTVVSPSTSDINIMIIIALILLAAFMIFIFFNKRHKD